MVTLIIVTAIFYIPFHIGPPVLLSLLYGRDAQQRKLYTQQIMLESFVTMVISLTAFFMLWETQLGIAIGIMLVMMAVPYFRVWKFRKAGFTAQDKE